MTIIDSTSASYEAIQQNLVNYVKSLENYATNWKDFYEGGAGTTILQLAAGLGSFLSQRALVSRREAYLDSATLRSSVVEISSTLGYNVNRATAPILTINLDIANPTLILKTQPIGSYKANPISILNDTTFNAGVNTVDVVLGEWETFNYTATDPKEFSHVLVPSLSIDNNLYELTVNGSPVEIIRNAEELTPLNILIRSFTYGVFLIWGDGVLGKALNLGDQIVFKYIRPSSALLENVVQVGDVTLDITGTINSANIKAYGTNEDSNIKLKSIASGYFSSKRRLITLADYESIGASYNGIISAYPRKQANSCCIIELAYITDSYRVLLPNEKTNYLAYLDQHKILGTSIILVDPVAIRVDVNLVIVISPTANTQSITSAIQAYLDTQTYKLGSVFSISGLFSVNIPNVLRVYMKTPTIDKKALFNQYFVLNSFNITFSTNSQLLESNGTDPLAGYIV